MNKDKNGTVSALFKILFTLTIASLSPSFSFSFSLQILQFTLIFSKF